MGWRKNKPAPMRCPTCNGTGRLHHKVWKVGKGYVSEGRVCGTCNGLKILPG